MVVIVDSHEKRSKVVNKLAEKCEIEITTLPVGDYVISDVVIERKSVFDFVQSIIDGRLWDQVHRLAQSDGRKLIVVEGSLAMPLKYHERIKPSMILGAVASVVCDWNIPVVVLPSVNWTAEFLYRIHENRYKDKSSLAPALRLKRKTTDPNDELRRVVEALPGIGANTADALLSEFKTLRNLFNANRVDLMRVDGIGSKRAIQLERLFTRPYSKIRKN